MGVASKHGLLLEDWWFGMQGVTGRGPCGVAVRDGAGMAGKRGFALGRLVVWDARKSGALALRARGSFGVMSRKDHPWCLWGCRETFVEFDARPSGVLSLFPDGSSSWGLSWAWQANMVCSWKIGGLGCKESPGVDLAGLWFAMSWAWQASAVCAWEIGGLRCKESRALALRVCGSLGVMLRRDHPWRLWGCQETFPR